MNGKSMLFDFALFELDAPVPVLKLGTPLFKDGIQEGYNMTYLKIINPSH
jgi:hypothetical protein